MEHRSHMVWRAPLLRSARMACGMMGALAASAALASSASAAISFTVPASVTEGDAVDITVTRPSADAAKALDVTVQAKTGSAKAGEDFDATPKTVHFKASEVSQDVSIDTIDDDLDENDENFKIAVDSGAADDPAPKKLIITDNDAEPTITLGSDVSAPEGTTNGTTTPFTFEVKLNHPSGREIALPYDVWDSDAIEPEDFTNGHETVIIPPNVTTATFSVPVVADNIDEPDEQFEVELSDPNHGTINGDGHAWATIVNDDYPALSVADARVKEGNGGMTAMTFTVTMSNPSSREIDVSYGAAPTGNARAQEDFEQRGGVLIFSPGETVDSFTVYVKGDKTPESDETFAAMIASPIGATIARSTAVGTIEDDDTPPAAAAPPASATGQSTPAPAATKAATKPTAKPAASVGPATSNRLTLTAPAFARPARVRSTLSCPGGAGSCQGTVSIFTVPQRKSKIAALRRELKIGTVRFNAQGGHRVIVSMRPSAKMMALLRKARTMRVHAYVVATDAKGKVLTKEMLGTLRFR